MSSELSDHFFYKTDAHKPSPKVKRCVGGRCEKGTVKVIWLPYEIRKDYPEKYDESEKPRITTPAFQREEAEKFRYWLLCIARWDNIAEPERTYFSGEDEFLYEGIVEYPLGILYNPEKDRIEEVTFESQEGLDYDFYTPYKSNNFYNMIGYFKGFTSNEVDCDDFRRWFFGEYKDRMTEKVKRRDRRKSNPNTDVSYAKRGYWLDEKPEDL